MERLIDRLCDDFEAAWRRGERPSIEAILSREPSADRADLLLHLLRLETGLRQADGQSPSVDEYRKRFPSESAIIESVLNDSAAAKDSTGRNPNPLDATTDHTSDSPVIRSDVSETVAAADSPGEMIGRYRIKRRLGEGAFGSVWLAVDEELQRRVAIKVPKPERFRGPQDAEAYLAEARTVASLDHPHIVPVYDVGRTAKGSIYVVSKYIEGHTLADRMASGRLPLDEITKLLTTSAQALHHAHGLRLIHRDIKPANILVEERTGNHYVADFGLAIREEDHLRDGRIAGTPTYMSPEQARGEGHRLDGRSDIFALGVMMYELLTGKRPFRGSTPNEIYHNIISVEPPPPRSIESDIPEELQRICLKALAKRAADRYATAAEMAEDLVQWQQGPATSTNERTIIPKGLRSFDADDADFFLDLLPGPRDRSGLPASLRFWKTRIEARDPEHTFNVGLIYGPSGCGKSSLVKAGLLPRLSGDVVPLYIEATPDETETRILRALQKHIAELPSDVSLAETCAWLRRQTGPKIVIIVDQFEQWLHSHRGETDAQLVTAFRQCDGTQLQAIVMVRDDFAMAAARFMDMLEVPIVQGKNFATVDLFDIDHADNVLVKFGRAFGKLPATPTPLADHEQAFVSAVVGGLADEGQVVSVRLALFAEMVKSKPWTMQTLLDVGGTDGIGVNFLEETFSSRNANPTHRLHGQAARAVLKSLLPDITTDIKGHMRSHAELLQDSGYESRPADFNALLRILDGELRLISPTDPEGANDSSRSSSVATRYYQLTHDYMVPALREWLTRKQQETRAGRAELKLAERTNLWTAKPENRYLPSLVEWYSIRTLTDRKRWTTPQQSLMQRAGRVYGSRIALGLAASVLLLLGGLWTKARVDEEQARTIASGLVAALLNAETRDVPRLVSELAPVRQWADPALQTALQSSDAKTQLHARIALLPVDASHVEPLQNALLDTTPENVLVLREVLQASGDQIAESYWPILQSPDTTIQQRLSAGAALAKFAPDDDRWTKVAGPVSNLLVNENPLRLSTWIEAYRPVRTPLIPELGIIFRDQTEAVTPTQRELATSLLETYAADNVDELAALILDANPKQIDALFDEFKNHGVTGQATMQSTLSRTRASEELWNDTDIVSLEDKPVPTEIKRLIQSVDGMITDRFAFVQSLKLTDLDSLTDALSRSGYRPVRVRPYNSQAFQEGLPPPNDLSPPLCAAIWHRDGGAWRFAVDLNVDEIQARDEKLRSEGFAAVDAAGYIGVRDEKLAELFSAVWGNATEEADDTRIYTGVLANEHTDAIKNQGQFFQQSLQGFRGLEGATKYCGVVKKADSKTTTGRIWDQSATDFSTFMPGDAIRWDIDPDAAPQVNLQKLHLNSLELAEAKLKSMKNDDTRLLLQHAEALLCVNEVNQAITQLDKVITLNPHSIAAYRLRIFAYALQDTLEPAKADIDKLRALNVLDQELNGWKALVAAANDEIAEANRLLANASLSTDTQTVDLLRLLDLDQAFMDGAWKSVGQDLVSPVAPGSRIELPVVAPETYTLRLNITPHLNEAGVNGGGFIIGLVMGGNRFQATLDFDDSSALENVDGQRIGNETTYRKKVLSDSIASLIECSVHEGSVNIRCNGETIIDWEGKPEQLSHAAYWATPNNQALFLGAYNKQYQVHSATLSTINGEIAVYPSVLERKSVTQSLELARWFARIALVLQSRQQDAAAQIYHSKSLQLLKDRFIDSSLKAGSLSSDPLLTGIANQAYLLSDPASIIHYSGLWTTSPALESQESYGLSPAEHLVKCDQLAARGYQITSIAAERIGAATVTASVWHRKITQAATRFHLAKQQANAAVVLARLGGREKIFASLRVTDNPESLTQFVHRCRDAGVTTKELWECVKIADKNRQSLQGEDRKIEDRVLFGLLLALGEFSLNDISEGNRQLAIDRIAALFENDPSSAIHGVTGWLLRQWGQTDIVKRVDQTPLAYDLNREWFTLAIDAGDAKFYQTYVVIQPGEYEIGSPVDEPGRFPNETKNRVRLTRPLAILDREVTRAEFEVSEIFKLPSTPISPSGDHPMVASSWYDSVLYCRWLSERAGFTEADQAYPDPKTLDSATYPLDGDSGFPKNWPVNLAKPGFRLPTEAEWEIAARAGMRSMYGFGADESLLDRFAWFANNSNRQTHVAKELRPNLGGLFDIHGNVFEWCHDWESGYDTTSTQVDPKGGQTGAIRVLRGGGWGNDAPDCRSARRDSNPPAGRYSNFGFRLALSLSIESPEAELAAEPVGRGTEGIAEQRP